MVDEEAFASSESSNERSSAVEESAVADAESMGNTGPALGIDKEREEKSAARETVDEESEVEAVLDCRKCAVSVTSSTVDSGDVDEVS
jgi:long-subunit fatty acid transport protein